MYEKRGSSLSTLRNTPGYSPVCGCRPASSPGNWLTESIPAGRKAGSPAPSILPTSTFAAAIRGREPGAIVLEGPTLVLRLLPRSRPGNSRTAAEDSCSRCPAVPCPAVSVFLRPQHCVDLADQLVRRERLDEQRQACAG